MSRRPKIRPMGLSAKVWDCEPSQALIGENAGKPMDLRHFFGAGSENDGPLLVGSRETKTKGFWERGNCHGLCGGFSKLE